MEKKVVRISVRNLVEFILRSGDLDSGSGVQDKEAMQKGSRIPVSYTHLDVYKRQAKDMDVRQKFLQKKKVL